MRNGPWISKQCFGCAFHAQGHSVDAESGDVEYDHRCHKLGREIDVKQTPKDCPFTAEDEDIRARNAELVGVLREAESAVVWVAMQTGNRDLANRIKGVLAKNGEGA